MDDRTCSWCGDPIEKSKRRTAIYCSDSCRYESFQAVPCTYCGLPSQSRDHFIPQAWASMMEGVGEITRTRIVPSCTECNSMAGDKKFTTIRAKRSYVQSRIRKKYGRLLRWRTWTQEELGELGPFLRSHVVHSQYAREITLLRLSWRGETEWYRRYRKLNRIAPASTGDVRKTGEV